jgi:hypothetical protein
MAKNHDIKTASKRLATSVQTVALGGVVATGMTRYVTFMRISPLTVQAGEGTKVYLCSGTLSAGEQIRVDPKYAGYRAPAVHHSCG